MTYRQTAQDCGWSTYIVCDYSLLASLKAFLTDSTNMTAMLSNKLRNITYNRSAYWTQDSDHTHWFSCFKKFEDGDFPWQICNWHRSFYFTVRPSVFFVRRLLPIRILSHFQFLLQKRLMVLGRDEALSVPHKCFWPDPPRSGFRAVSKSVKGPPSSKTIFLKLDLNDKINLQIN